MDIRPKIKYNWKLLAAFAVVASGLVALTGSLLMSAGILLLLFVADYLIGVFADRGK